MLSVPIRRQECFITEEEFTCFKKEVADQFQALRAILDLQHQQIDLLSSHNTKFNQQVKATPALNEGLERENRELRVRIQELEVQILYIRKQKAGFQVHSEEVLSEPSYKMASSCNSQECLSKLSLSSGSHHSLQEDHSPQQASSKCMIDNRKTNENQQGFEEDDDEQIECVWDDSSKPAPKTDILNNEKHLHNPHNKEFEVDKKEECMTITKVAGGQSFLSPAHSFIYKQPLTIQTHSTFKIKRLKVKDIFLVGVTTIYALGVENAFRHKEVIAYSSSGDLWVEGDSTKSGREVQRGQWLEMMVDQVSSTVSWLMSGVLMAKVAIPRQMVNKELFLTVMMFNKDDKVELLCHSK